MTKIDDLTKADVQGFVKDLEGDLLELYAALLDRIQEAIQEDPLSFEVEDLFSRPILDESGEGWYN